MQLTNNVLLLLAACNSHGLKTDMEGMLQDNVREETFDEGAKQEADFFSYVATSYKHYLNGDDEECERVDSKQSRIFQDKAEADQQKVQELGQVIAL